MTWLNDIGNTKGIGYDYTVKKKQEGEKKKRQLQKKARRLEKKQQIKQRVRYVTKQLLGKLNCKKSR